MKYPISVITIMALALSGSAQSGSTSPGLAELPRVTIHLKESGPAFPSAFNHFEVIDDRADTARIGIHTFVPSILGHSRNRQLVFSQPAAAEIAGFLNKYYNRPDAQWSALIVLRNLWLSDANYLREEKVRDPNVLSHRTHIRLKAEIYACRDSVYIPIMRFDTLQTYKRSNQYNNWNSYYSLWENDLTAVLGEMTDSLSGLTGARVETGRRLQWADILQFNESRFQPAIAASNVLTTGVYASFQEFRDNAPSIRHFEIQQENGDHLLYINDATGASQYSHDAWGYCDGKTIFIMRDGKLYPLWKEGKTFYFFSQAYKEHTGVGVPLYTPGSPAAVSGAPVVGAGGKVLGGLRVASGTPAVIAVPITRVGTNAQRIYTVDMDSGTIY
jgi:hypothetical protein